MAEIEMKEIVKEYVSAGNKVTAVDRFSLSVRDKEFLVLVGPSGCGKSTVLRMIAGLEDITGGELFVGGRRANGLTPQERDIAMVFQNYALYPHMNVYKNMEFGLKMRGIEKQERKKRILDTAKELQIEELLLRRPAQLSGGQRQRVALGRAMVRQPQVFLLDEPLSNLDAKLRTETRIQISRLHKKLGATFVYVTHDQTEAMTMADRIVVMKDGVIQQAGTPQEIYGKPANLFVAGFVGSPPMNFIPGQMEMGSQNEGAMLKLCGRRFPMPTTLWEAVKGSTGGEPGTQVIVGIRPEDIKLWGEGEKPQGNIWELGTNTVSLEEDLGPERCIYMDICGQELIGRVSSATKRGGTKMTVGFSPEKIHLFHGETGQTISIFSTGFEKDEKIMI